jgi:hypothetical protein
MKLHKVQVPKDFIPMGERNTKLTTISIILRGFKEIESYKKLHSSLIETGFTQIDEDDLRLFIKHIKTEKDTCDFLNFHNEWIFTLCQMFTKFNITYFYKVPIDYTCTIHRLEFDGIMEYSVHNSFYN